MAYFCFALFQSFLWPFTQQLVSHPSFFFKNAPLLSELWSFYQKRSHISNCRESIFIATAWVTCCLTQNVEGNRIIRSKGKKDKDKHIAQSLRQSSQILEFLSWPPASDWTVTEKFMKKLSLPSSPSVGNTTTSIHQPISSLYLKMGKSSGKLLALQGGTAFCALISMVSNVEVLFSWIRHQHCI